MAEANTPLSMPERISRLDFLRVRPGSATKTGFDLDMPEPTFNSARLRADFGAWDQPEGSDADADLRVLRALHEGALTQFRDMVETLAQVRDDDDPSLNKDGRLKLAAKLVQPKLEKLSTQAERELTRVDEAIGAIERELVTASRTADPTESALFPEIRTALRAMTSEERGRFIAKAIDASDLLTLQAIASAPANLSGGPKPSQYQAAVDAVLAHRAPEQSKRLEALRIGKARALQALSALDRKANQVIDFKKARELLEREARRNTGD